MRAVSPLILRPAPPRTRQSSPISSRIMRSLGELSETSPVSMMILEAVRLSMKRFTES